MPSLDGFSTWLDYEFLVLKVVLVVAVLLWAGRALLGFVERSPLPTGQLVLSVSVIAILSSVVVVWWLGRDSQ